MSRSIGRLASWWVVPFLLLAGCGADRTKIAAKPSPPPLPAPTPDAGVSPPAETCGWSKTLSGGGGTIFSMATAKNGDIVVAGEFQTQLIIDGEPLLTAPDGINAYVLRLDAAGHPLWSRSFPNGGHAVAGVDDAGDLIVTAEFSGTLDFGSVSLASASTDGFIASFAPDGTARWAVALGAVGLPDGGAPMAIAVGGSGRSAIINAFSGGAGTDGLYLASFDGSGALVWHHEFAWTSLVPNMPPAPVMMYDTPLALSEAGDVFLSLSIGLSTETVDTIDLGGGTLTFDGSSDNDVLAARFDAAGHHQWSRVLESPARFSSASTFMMGLTPAFGPGGASYVVGSFGGGYDIGCGAMAATQTEDGASVGHFVARLNDDGTCRWSRTTGAVEGRELVARSDGTLLVSGSDGNAVSLATIDATGSVVSERMFGPGFAVADKMALSTSGDIVLAGVIFDQGRVDFCDHSLRGLNSDGFIATLK